METLILICLFIIIFILIIGCIFLNQNNDEKEEKKLINLEEQIYFKKLYFMTRSEIDFYNTIKELENDYNIVPQISLGTIIEKKTNNRNNLNKYIDYAIFSKDYSNLLLLIELNDATHNQESRRKRDIEVKNICDEAGIKLITFYTSKPNEKEYVINRIIENINSNNSLN